MDRLSHIIRYVTGQPWAIRPDYAAIIQDLIVTRRAGHRFTAEEIQARIGAATPARRSNGSGASSVAVIPIIGVISHRMELLSDV